MKLTIQQIESRQLELSKKITSYKNKKGSDPNRNIVLHSIINNIQHEIFGLQWVIDHWENGYNEII